jgi:DNA (cytosine-5)-methyltransferase 1
VDTTKTITHISLCAGYGGIDIGLKRCLPTLRTILVSEIEAYAVANLVAKMEAGQMDPAPIWTDLKTLPWDCVPKGVSILSGGFPCQPFSAAGNREGDEDPRHLFPYIKNAIRTIQPRLVFLENVEGIISAKLKGDGWEDPAGTPVLLHVLRELERVGYDSTAGVFSAAEVGATHQRKRVFILANSEGARLEGHFGVQAGCGESRRNPSQPEGPISRGDCGGTFWPARPGEPQHEWEEPRVVGDTAGGQVGSRESGELGEEAQGGEGESATVADPSAELADTGHSESSGRDGEAQGQLRESRGESAPQDCGDGELANADPDRLQGCSLSDEQGQEDHKANGKSQRQTQPLMGGAANGFTSGLDATANRVDRLRLLGNGVVPDTCEVAFRTLYKELCEKH